MRQVVCTWAGQTTNNVAESQAADHDYQSLISDGEMYSMSNDHPLLRGSVFHGKVNQPMSIAKSTAGRNCRLLVEYNLIELQINTT